MQKKSTNTDQPSFVCSFEAGKSSSVVGIAVENKSTEKSLQIRIVRAKRHNRVQKKRTEKEKCVYYGH